VLVEGKDIRDWDTAELCSRIGYVFQNPFTQISGIKPTVFEEVAIGLENLGVPKQEMLERVTKVCEQLDIGHLIKNNPNELSGGQRQRVAFASIIAMDTETLVIDEPTSQLDPEGTENVFNIINQLKHSNKTIILVEHKIDLIADFCDEILVMENGTIVYSGPTKEILAKRELMDHNAAIPEVAKFGHAMNDAGKPLSRIPVTLSEALDLVKERSAR